MYDVYTKLSFGTSKFVSQTRYVGTNYLWREFRSKFKIARAVL